MKYVRLEASERTPLPGDVDVGKANPRRRIEVTVVLRERGGLEASVQRLAAQPLGHRPKLTREEFAEAHGCSDRDIRRVERFASRFRLRRVADRAAQAVGADDRSMRTIELRGSIRWFSRAFRVQLRRYRSEEGSHRGYTGALQIPESLKEIVQAVIGLDNRKAARPFMRRLRPLGGAIALAGGGQSFFPNEVAQIYQFPPAATGKGQTIGIIELGGGFRRRDLATYFDQLGIPLPAITSVPVGRAANAPTGNPNSDDAEVMLDIEVAGAVAPDADIVVYFAPNTTRGFLRGINAAIYDRVNRPSIVSISWGAAESSWSVQSMQAIDQAFQAAAAMGITVCAASGDNGSSDGVAGRLAHADFPASSPWALACGGTELVARDKVRTTEVVWNDGPDGGATGGGVSGLFPHPDYQANAHVPASLNPGGNPGRGLPDVAGNASPITGYRVRVDGEDGVIGGTSAVAPLWAGLVALLNEKLGDEVGFLHPDLYGRIASAGALFDVVDGNNDLRGNLGGYAAGQGWDACTGLGTPNGAAILIALSS
jgi:kumamolisin